MHSSLPPRHRQVATRAASQLPVGGAQTSSLRTLLEPTCSAATRCGIVESSLVPLPSCPLELRPKAYSAPSDDTHSECVSPQAHATMFMSFSPEMGLGRNTSPQSPWPSRPKSPLNRRKCSIVRLWGFSQTVDPDSQLCTRCCCCCVCNGEQHTLSFAPCPTHRRPRSVAPSCTTARAPWPEACVQIDLMQRQHQRQLWTRCRVRDRARLSVEH